MPPCPISPSLISAELTSPGAAERGCGAQAESRLWGRAAIPRAPSHRLGARQAGSAARFRWVLGSSQASNSGEGPLLPPGRERAGGEGAIEQPSAPLQEPRVAHQGVLSVRNAFHFLRDDGRQDCPLVTCADQSYIRLRNKLPVKPPAGEKASFRFVLSC